MILLSIFSFSLFHVYVIMTLDKVEINVTKNLEDRPILIDPITHQRTSKTSTHMKLFNLSRSVQGLRPVVKPKIKRWRMDIQIQYRGLIL